MPLIFRFRRARRQMNVTEHRHGGAATLFHAAAPAYALRRYAIHAIRAVYNAYYYCRFDDIFFARFYFRQLTRRGQVPYHTPLFSRIFTS